jgi:hypothetical protein
MKCSSMNEESELINLFDNLQIQQSDYESSELTNLENKDNLIQTLIALIKKSEISCNINIHIFDNIIIVDDVLFGMNMHNIEDDSEILPVYEPILRLAAYNEQKIPQKGDPKWWDEYCSEFESSMGHLRNSSYNNSSLNIKELIEQYDIIETEIIKLTIIILNNGKSDYSDINLVRMYIISIYIDYFFKKNNIGSIYDEEFLYNNKYFIQFGERTIEFLKSNDQYFSYNINYYGKYINRSLLSLLYGARNTLILFAPYGYDALKDNVDYIDLNIREIMGFKREALKYFAINNLIELKLHKKKIHIDNLNDYASIISKGARLFE